LFTKHCNTATKALQYSNQSTAIQQPKHCNTATKALQYSNQSTQRLGKYWGRDRGSDDSSRPSEFCRQLPAGRMHQRFLILWDTTCTVLSKTIEISYKHMTSIAKQGVLPFNTEEGGNIFLRYSIFNGARSVVS
jgi:hypothetical protein